MSLSSLTSYTTAPSYTRYLYEPTASWSGNPETQATMAVLGYLTGDQNTLVFSVNAAAAISAGVDLSTNKTSITVKDLVGSNSNPVVSYYSVNMGQNTVSGTEWRLQFWITLTDGTSTSYIFVKGKPTEQEQKPH